jgi:hypothetical protein
MRTRNKEKIVRKIDVGIESKQGKPISVRPFDEDDKKLAEIAGETGENKSAIVRRMIRFALSEGSQQFAVGRCQEKLDWLVRTGRQNETVNLERSGNLAEIRDGVDRLESGLEKVTELLGIMSSLATEMYSMSSMSVSSLNLIFTKLIEYASPVTDDRKKSVFIASTAMVELIEHAVTDLSKCLLFHEHLGPDVSMERSYLGTKIKVLKQRIESIPKVQDKRPDAS